MARKYEILCSRHRTHCVPQIRRHHDKLTRICNWLVVSEGHAIGRHYERVVYADRATKRLTTTTWPSHEVAKEVRLKVDACNTSKERIMKTVERAWTKKMLRIASIDVGHWIFHLYMLSIVYHDHPIA